jgi:hypothetical protein
MMNNTKVSQRLYIDDYIEQVNKKQNIICGDYCLIKRKSSYTDFILCDGMGSGPKANIAAIMCANRVLELMDNGVSIYVACEKAVKLMHRARTETVPFAAFTVVRIMKSGQFVALSYEIPGPLLVSNGASSELKLRHFPMAGEIVSESTGVLRDGASLVLCSDGVTQAGLGILEGLGLGLEGFNYLINKELTKGTPFLEIPKAVIKTTHLLSGYVHADDTTIAVLTARPAKVLNILTGPPKLKKDDETYVNKFMQRDGAKVVCGSSTSDIVAKALNEELEIIVNATSFTKPPRYKIKGLDLVTEGAITLNQLYNIIDEPVETYDEESCVSELAKLVKDSDIIRMYIGGAKNRVHSDISFKQGGILERHKIIELLIDKFEKAGKIVKRYDV